MAPPIVDDVLSSPGRVLDAGLRHQLEPLFSYDFGAVRVHDDARATQAAASVNARAFTVGRHIAFGVGEYRPETSEGQRLLAHELAHVVQQRSHHPVSSSTLTLSHPNDASERDADSAAQRAIKGEQTAKLGLHPPMLQRTVREQVVRDFQPGAQVCMVHLHGNEQNALHVAQELRRTRCANLVHLNSTGREVHVDVSAGGQQRTCLADPNRIFTATGISSNALVGTCPAAFAAGARNDLVDFRDNQLAPAIRECRGGSVSSSGLSGRLPVVAFHNNTPRGFSIRSYRATRGTSDARAAARGSEVPSNFSNPSELGGTDPDPLRLRDPDNFLLVTDPGDFTALRNEANVVLQSRQRSRLSAGDDGSLSIAMAGERYINVEAERKNYVSDTDRFFLTNRALAERALRQLGVGNQPCQSPSEGASTPEAESSPEGPIEHQETIVDWLTHLLQEVLRVLNQWENAPRPLPREASPTNLPRSCRSFHSQVDLDARKSHWAGVIGRMPLSDVVDWTIGVSRPPAAAVAEATAQRDCLLFAIRTAAARPSSPLSLPSDGHTQSARRDFRRQQRIWQEKFNFTRSTPFDRISNQARGICRGLILPGELRWDPRNPRHRVCWNVATPGSGSAPAIPTGSRMLTYEERQREILQASSAPGISRHHFGTDFDLFDPAMDPVNWLAGGRFADEYSWLARNASTYGFVQPMTATSTFMRIGYMEERWHWSYHPIAQALVDFVRVHQADLQRALFRRWGLQRRFSFIRTHWRDFFFNVGEHGRF